MQFLYVSIIEMFLFDCLILIFLIFLSYYFTVAVKELSGDEYLLRLSMISALQGFLKVSEIFFKKLLHVFVSINFFFSDF